MKKRTEIKNKKLRTALFLHIMLVVLEMIDTNYAYAEDGLGMLIYYTEDSNLLCLLTSALFTIVMLPIIYRGQMTGFVSTYLMRNASKKERKTVLPVWLLVLRYVTSCCLLVTFLVVLFVLGPANGYHAMLVEGTHLINHVGAPLLSLHILLFLETEPRQMLPAWAPLCAVGVTTLYAVPVLGLNIAKRYVGPYPFLHVYEQSVLQSVLWFLAILGGNALIAVLVKKVYDRCIRKK